MPDRIKGNVPSGMGFVCNFTWRGLDSSVLGCAMKQAQMAVAFSWPLSFCWMAGVAQFGMGFGFKSTVQPCRYGSLFPGARGFGADGPAASPPELHLKIYLKMNDHYSSHNYSSFSPGKGC
jgi:hypothetical protein